MTEQEKNFENEPEAPVMDADQQAVDSKEEQVSNENLAEEALTVEAQLQQALQEKAELEDRLIRAQAELINYRRRAQNEIEQFRKYEGLNLVRDLLPTIDNLQRAVAAADQASDVQNLKMGVEMVARQLIETLQRHKIETIPAQGAAFDPNLHEAVQQLPSDDQPAMHILQELETGYKMQDRIVRPAKVIVSTGPAAETRAEQ